MSLGRRADSLLAEPLPPHSGAVGEKAANYVGLLHLSSLKSYGEIARLWDRLLEGGWGSL